MLDSRSAIQTMTTPPTNASSVLLIDDDEELCDLLRKFLNNDGFVIQVVNDGAQGLEQALSGDHGVIVLDVMLPSMNGFDVLRELRQRSQVPVIMLTARGEDVDRIVGLEMGADDYQAKPFNPRELAARIRAIQRRLTPGNRRVPADEGTVVVVGDVVLNPQLRSVVRGEEDVPVTSVEFAILDILLRAAGGTVSREALAKEALGRRLSYSDRSVDVHVSNLRKKLGPLRGGGERIKSIRGVGYQYATG